MFPKEILEALKILENNGYEAYLVGGCVRDYLLKRECQDYDLTTNAAPAAIMAAFAQFHPYQVNKEFGTVSVKSGQYTLEITPYRREKGAIKHRKPAELSYIQDVKADIFRRDFTINALLADSKGEIHDYVQGLNDLQNKLIKAIGDPQRRFQEDALRILRAIRFKVKLNFKIEDLTEKALFTEADLLTAISAERKRDEFIQIITCQSAEALLKYRAIFNLFIDYRQVNPLIWQTNNLYLRLYLLNPTFDYTKLKFSKKEVQIIQEFAEYTKTEHLIKLLSKIKYPADFLEFQRVVNKKDYRRFFKDNAAYIVNRHNLAIKGEELLKLGYRNQTIGQIMDEIIARIQAKEFENNNTAIHNYLLTQKKHH